MVSYYSFFVHIKMSYCWFNRQELLKKAKDRYHNCGAKEKAAKYYTDNKEVWKGKANNKYRNSSEDKKEVKRKYGRNRCRKMKEKRG